MTELKETPTLKDLQDYLAQICQERGWTKDSPTEKFVLFIEEVGELAKAMRQAAGLYEEHAKPRELSLEEEFADPTRCATRLTGDQALTSGTKTARKSVYFPVGVLVFQTRPVKHSFQESKGAEPYVAQKSDLIILPVFVLSQIERPGRAIARGTARRLHLQYVCGLLSTGYAERAREAARSSSLLNVT